MCSLRIGLNRAAKGKSLMKIKRFTSLIAVLALATFVGIAQQSTVEPSAEKLQKHVSYLASDALDGRRTGTAGAMMPRAISPVSSSVSASGLRPRPTHGNST